MYIVVGQVTRFMKTYMAKEVDLSAKRKRKQKTKSDDIWEPEEKLMIDLKVEAGGTISNTILVLNEGIKNQPCSSRVAYSSK
jgi:hypothetical protein